MNNVGKHNESTSSPSLYERNALFLVIAFGIASVFSAAIFLYYGEINNSWQFQTIGLLFSVVAVIDFLTLFLIRRGKTTEAIIILLINASIALLVIPFLVQGTGILSGLSAILFIITVTSLAIHPRYIFHGIIVSIFVGLAIFFVDISIQYKRLSVPQLLEISPYISIGLLVLIGFITLRQFNYYTLRVKIVFGVLITAVTIIATLALFGSSEIRQVVNQLTKRYEEESRARIDKEIITIASNEAEIVDASLEAILNDLISFADTRLRLEEQKVLLGQGIYWDAHTRIFQLPSGQYGNASTDISSVFIPSTIPIDEALLVDLNTTAYLDFNAPAFLNSHPEVVAIYYISTNGATTYYPNINLAENVLPNFDPRNESFFSIANPQNNPNHEPKWTEAHLDPAGQGLIVTLSIPVYNGGSFLGVTAVDIQLSKISERVSNIKPGETGFAFLVNSSGNILAMPEQGYRLYEIQPEVIEGNQSPRQSILVKGSFDLQAVTSRIINGETDVTTIQVNNENLYIAFAPLKTPNYRLAIVAPESEFIGEIANAKTETDTSLEKFVQNNVFILAILFIAALLASLWVGRLITMPLIHLTRIVDTISEGDLSVRANITTEDETGRLASAFNKVTEKLSTTLSQLEQRITERTSELELANKSNERRAIQFESVARISQIIGSNNSGEDLLPRIAEVIGNQFNFYHVGIFLLDLHKEYAILTASNSEGGRKLLAQNHRILVNESSIVGFASKSGRPRIALDTGIDSNYATNPDLSRTRSEAALPFIVGSEVIGVLDVQSDEKNAFSNEDINIMTALAGQVSIAIQNARSYQQTREALQRAENTSMELSKQNWKQFAEQKQIDSVLFDGVNTKTISKTSEQMPHNLAIPLILRGVKIGSIKLNSMDPLRTWNEDELALLQAAADRTTLAIENARLLLEAQKRASKERTIGEISSKISGLVNIENILETAIKELGTNLTNTDIAIQFTQEDSEQNS